MAPTTSTTSVKAARPRLRLLTTTDSQVESDEALVRAAADGQLNARHQLYDRHAPEVARLLRRVLGSDQDAEDVLHDAFVIVLERLGALKTPALFRTWFMRIAIYQARGLIRSRTRRRWLRFLSGEDPVEEPVRLPPPEETGQVLRAVYKILEAMPADERIAYVLRHLDKEGLGEIACVCGVSLSTIKRRLKRAEQLFMSGAEKHPALQEWLEGETS